MVGSVVLLILSLGALLVLEDGWKAAAAALAIGAGTGAVLALIVAVTLADQIRRS